MSQQPRIEVADFHVAELDCAEEVRVLRRELEQREGIAALDFDVLRGRMKVRYDVQQLAPAAIIAWVAEAGMRAEPWRATPAAASIRDDKLLATLVSGAAVLIGFAVHWWYTGSVSAALGVGEQATPWASRAIYGMAILSAYRFVLPKAWSALRGRRADMNLLIVAATLGAVALGEWLEAAAVSFLFSLALLLEHWSVGRARRAITALLQETPPIAHVQREGEMFDAPVEDVSPGDVVLVRPGERVPLDGDVLAGRSAVNQAPITGESIPVAKQTGDEVFAGSINGEGILTVSVTHAANDSLLARIIRMVEDAQSRRAESEQWVERFARFYTPAAMLLSLLIAVSPPLLFGASWPAWIYNGLVLLVIACPCALVISTPVSVVSALTAAARRGVLIKGGRHLEACAGIVAIAFDKTGTLTIGRPEVQQVRALRGEDRQRVLQVAAGLEANSNHPLAAALVRAAEREGIVAAQVQDVQARAGLGAEGRFEEQLWWIGGRRLVEEQAEWTTEAERLKAEWEAEGWTVVAVGCRDRLVGLIGLADQLREGANEVIGELRRLGVRRLVLLTGDSEATARAIASRVGVDAYRAGMLPEDKLREVQRLVEQQSTAMIGDGVNDSPALAAASVGVAMGGVGSDAAIETADVTLMSDDLGRIPWLIGHARRTVRIVRQNILFALGTKLIFVVLAAFGIASLWLAIVADMGASLLVILNALRLLNASGPLPEARSAKTAEEVRR